MAKIGLSDGFTVIPEGTYIFKVTAVNYKEDFGKMEVSMQTQDGQKHIERFTLLKANGEPNEGALNAFSYFARTVLNNFSLSEIDHTDLIGHFVECDVEHDVQPNKNNPDKTVTFVRLTEKRPSDGWENVEASSLVSPGKASSGTPASHGQAISGKKPSVDLAALLG